MEKQEYSLFPLFNRCQSFSFRIPFPITFSFLLRLQAPPVSQEISRIEYLASRKEEGWVE